MSVPKGWQFTVDNVGIPVATFGKFILITVHDLFPNIKVP